MKNNNQAIYITGIVALAVVILGSMFIDNFNPTSQDTISATGDASVQVKPDVVKVYLTIEERSNSSATAQDKAEQDYNKLVTSLTSQSFKEEEIQTQYFNIYPEYDYTNEGTKLKGYVAAHSIVVEFSSNQTSKIGKVVDAGMDSGAKIASINFELSKAKETEYKAQVLGEAAKSAKVKAEALAEGAGKKLGNLVSVSENSFSYYPWVAYSRTEGSMDSGADVKAQVANITPGNQVVQASVVAVYKIR